MELYSGTLSAGSALVILCTFGLTVLLSMVVLTLVWVRRNVQPLRSRMPKLLLSFNILAILYSASVTFNYVFVEKTQTPCWVFVIIYMMSNSLIGTLVVFRIIKLIFDYSVAVERSNMTHRDANEMMKLTVTGKTVPEQADSDNAENPTVNSEESSTLSHSGSEPDSISQMVGGDRHGSLKYGVEDHEASMVEGKWFIQHRSWFSTTNSVLFCCLSILLTGIVPLIIVGLISPPAKRTEDYECEGTLTRSIMYTAQVFIFVVFLASLYPRLRGVRDAFMIQDELRALVILAAIVTVSFFGIGFLPKTEFPIRSYNTVLFVLGLVLISAAYPLWLSYTRYNTRRRFSIVSHGSKRSLGAHSDGVREARSNSHQRRSGHKNQVDDDDDLETNELSVYSLTPVLENNDCRKLFQEHLVSEFSVENILFWESVERYRREALQLEERYKHLRTRDDQNRVSRIRKLIYRKATVVYNTFIARGSYNEVNIPYVLRDEIKRGLDTRANLGRGSRQGSSAADEDRKSREMSVSEVQLMKLGHTSSISNISLGGTHNSLGGTASSVNSLFEEPNASSYINHTLFDKAQLCVFDLMNRDSFPRFCAKESYGHSLEIISKARAEEALNAV